MFKDIIGYLLLSWCLIINCHASDKKLSVNDRLIDKNLQQHGAGFANPEHRKMGDNVVLKWAPLQAPESNLLQLPNGLHLTYGEIIMYAGDLFGDMLHPISSCASEKQEHCFRLQFAPLAIYQGGTVPHCENPIELISKYRNYFIEFTANLEKAVEEGQPEWEFYKQQSDDNTATLNKIGCGGSVISKFIPLGTYLKLAQLNFDHFVPDSLTAYKAGHKVALETAQQAHYFLQEGNTEKAQTTLQLAYAQNAFANHYLTDSMSSGHMRVPRRAIHHDILLPAILNLVIANFMHDEDSRLGLNVTNAQGIRWTAYGDGYLQHPNATTHKEILSKIVQISADAVYSTFQTGNVPDVYEEFNWLPDFQAIDEINNHSPLFKVVDGTLLKRNDSHDPNDYSWTEYWSGLFTLIDFQIG